MADNKKYYYLKLVDNFYDRDEMIMLESMPDGYMYSNILLKLYLRSLKNEGKLLFNDRIPYNSTMLANITRFPVGVIEKALKIFLELGLIEILDNGAIYMLDIQNFIGKSTTEADRKREYRRRIDEEKKMLGQMSRQISDKSTLEIEQEIEQETEIDLEQELKIDTEKQQEIEKNVVDKVKLYFNDVTFKELATIKNEFLKKEKDIYYLMEKLILTYENKNVENKIGYLVSAIRDDYKLKENYSIDKNLMAWEHEFYIKPNDPIVKDRVEYYRNLNKKNKGVAYC